MKKIIFLFITLFTLQGFAQEVSKEYDKIGKFYHGVAIVWKNGLCGVIKSSGKEIVKPEYEKYALLEVMAFHTLPKKGK
ncbi:MAG: WG repeat-containing protein [Chitinophagaceae bacterium]|nr:WG repeat-containing protein [Chitinophagaceae bacterium]